MVLSKIPTLKFENLHKFLPSLGILLIFLGSFLLLTVLKIKPDASIPLGNLSLTISGTALLIIIAYILFGFIFTIVGVIIWAMSPQRSSKKAKYKKERKQHEKKAEDVETNPAETVEEDETLTDKKSRNPENIGDYFA